MLGRRDDRLVRVRDALLLQDAVAPVARAAGRLYFTCPDYGCGLRLDWVQRVRHESADWEFALSDTEDVGARERQLQPRVCAASLVFVALDEVPAADKVDGNVVDGGADDAD